MSIFTPWRLQQATDASTSGGINCKGIEIFQDAVSIQCAHPQAQDGTHTSCKSSGARKSRIISIPSSFLMQKSGQEI